MPAVPSVPTFGPSIIPASVLNQLADALRFAQAPPKVKATQSVSQNLTTGVATSINFDAAAIDTYVMWDAGLPSRLTALYTGHYLAGGGVSFASNSTSYRIARWAINGTVVIDGNVLVQPSSAGVSTRVAARTTIVYLVEGDYVELQAQHAIGSTLATSVILGDPSSASATFIGQ